MTPPLSRRELALVAAATAALAAGASFVPTGGEGFIKALQPTLWVLAWIAPSWLVIERRKKDPMKELGLSVKPSDPLSWLLALATLPAYGLVRVLMTPHFQAPHLRLWSLPEQLLFTALPEETFFRGSLQPSLAPARPYVSIIMTSVLFALVHLATDRGNPARLLVFFPSLLFGWLRHRTGSVVPGIVYHALCNVLEEHLRSA